MKKTSLFCASALLLGALGTAEEPKKTAPAGQQAAPP